MAGGNMGKLPRGAKAPRVANSGKLFMRLMSYVFKDYKWHCLAVFLLIFVGVIANVQGTMFTKNLIDDYITPFLLTDEPDDKQKNLPDCRQAGHLPSEANC